MGIQDLLSSSASSEDDVVMFQYDPAERYQHNQQTEFQQRRPVARLPSLSVLMQPRAPFEYAQQSQAQSQPNQQGAYYPAGQAQQSPYSQQQQVQYYPPASPISGQQQQQQSWSPASATSSVDSTCGDAPFPIRRQTFYAREGQQNSKQQRPSCSCGCDPVSSDDEAMMIAPRPVAVNQQKMDISPTNKSSAPPTAGGAAGAASGKKSRYLREMDRRAILARLDKGEKQSVLAKEYQVSRSSICNLFKHRDEVLSRVNQNPFTKHPKKPRTASTANGGIANKATEKLITCVKAIYSPFTQTGGAIQHNQQGVPSGQQLMYDASGRVHRVNSRAASVLLSILDKPDLTAPEFRRCSNQIMLLLIEEALVMIPTLNAAVVSASGPQRLSPSPLCAITMEQANQHAILDVFHSVEPHCPRGYVQFERSQWHQDVKIKLLDAQLSSALYNHSVLLLDVAVTSPPTVAFVIESLLRNGALEAKVTIVAVFVTRAVVEMVAARFPAVKIIATEIESGLAPPPPQQPTGLQQHQERIGNNEPMLMPRSMLFKQRLEQLQHSSLVI
ncbi:putative uracil phosphoribosyltransferase [Globisporangium polare]